MSTSAEWSSPPPDKTMDAAAASPRGRLSRPKKLAFSVVVVVAFFGLLELVLAVVGVRPRAATEDPYVGFSSYAPLFVETGVGEHGPRMVTAPNKLEWFNKQSFPRAKPAGTYRIFCLGGSTTYGHPYDDATSFAGWLRELLPAADRSRRWEVINAGGISYASYRVARLMEELVEYEPDLFVILSGHNEFLERRTYAKIIETPEAVRGLGALAGRTRTGTLLGRLFGGAPAPDAGESRTELAGEVHEILGSSIGLDAYFRDDEFARQVLAHYRFNLGRMVELARGAGAEVVLVTPPSDLKDTSPFKSQHRAGLTEGERAAFDAHYRAAQAAYRANDLDAALAAIEAAVALDGRHAHALYLQGRILFDLEGFAEAKAAFVKARDEDVCPLRALSPAREIVADVAARHGVPLVDFAAFVERESPHGIPGSNLFLDHVHPTIAGNRLAALEIIDALIARKTVRPGAGWTAAAVARIAAEVEGRLDRAAHGRALRNLSKVLGWAGKREEANRLALEAVELAPEDALAQYQAGNALFEQAEFAAAVDRYTQAIALDARSPEAHYGLGNALAELGQLEPAIASLRRAVQVAPDFADAHYNLSGLYEAAGDAGRAASHLRQAIAARPEHYLSHNRLGIILAGQGRLADAEKHFERAVSLHPRYADARANLGSVCALQGRTTEAVRHFRAALWIQPDHAAALAALSQYSGSKD